MQLCISIVKEGHDINFVLIKIDTFFRQTGSDHLRSFPDRLIKAVDFIKHLAYHRFLDAAQFTNFLHCLLVLFSFPGECSFVFGRRINASEDALGVLMLSSYDVVLHLFWVVSQQLIWSVFLVFIETLDKSNIAFICH